MFTILLLIFIINSLEYIKTNKTYIIPRTTVPIKLILSKKVNSPTFTMGSKYPHFILLVESLFIIYTYIIINKNLFYSQIPVPFLNQRFGNARTLIFRWELYRNFCTSRYMIIYAPVTYSPFL